MAVCLKRVSEGMGRHWSHEERGVVWWAHQVRVESL